MGTGQALTRVLPLLFLLALPVRAEFDVADYEINASLKDDRQRQQASAEIEAGRQRELARAAEEAARRQAEDVARQAAWLALPADERLLRTRCVPCHGLDPVDAVRHALPGWLAVTLRMKYANKAELSTADIWQISLHLSRRLPAGRADAAFEWVSLLVAIPLILIYPLWRYRRHQRKQ